MGFYAANQTLCPPQDLLAPFKYGFHREIVTGTTEEQTIYYITPEGTRIGSRKALDPHIKDLKHVNQENFTFLPITLQINDPLHKYQSTRPAPTRRPTPRCPQWLHQIAFEDNTPRPPNEDNIHQGKTKPRRLMDIKIDITNLPRGYRWQIDRARQHQLEIRGTSSDPESYRHGTKKGEKLENSSRRDNNRSPKPKRAIPPKRPMMGIHEVIIYKDKPPDEADRHEWP